MTEIETASVDLVIADLPYGTTACGWDSIIPFEPLWAELNRIAKPNAAMIFTAAQPFTTALIASNMTAFRYCLVWEKGISTGFLNARKMPLRAHEDLVVFYRKLPTYNPQMTDAPMVKVTLSGERGEVYGAFQKKTPYASDQRFPRSVIRLKSEKQSTKVHPTQKPVALLEYLIETFSNPGDVVFDPTMGSGTTGVAAKNLNRAFVGIERDPKYFAAAEARLGIAA